MKTRCVNPNTDGWEDYGGRGIAYCERWEDFENFLADMGERPAGTTLDRRDVAGDYTSENCRWSSQAEQNRNRRSSKIPLSEVPTILAALHQGEGPCSIARRYGVASSTISHIKRRSHGPVRN